MANNHFILSDRFKQHINSWCGVHGLMYTDGNLNWFPAPVSLLPSKFSASAFNTAQAMQPLWNKLMDRIARDRSFILKELSCVGEADDFTNRLISLYKEVPEEQLTNGVQFGIFRSDYMLDEDSSLLQVEINTIAASFGCLSKKVRSFHNHFLNRFEGDKDIQQLAKSVYEDEHVQISTINGAHQENYSLEKIAASLALAYRVSMKKENSVVLFVVQPGERNVRIYCLLLYTCNSP
jgi:glutathione synthase